MLRPQRAANLSPAHKRDFRGQARAIEPVIREALARLSPVTGLPAADIVGGFWTRTNDPEIDIIGADKGPIATKIAFAGTIKWLDREPLTQSDINRLSRDLSAVAGADTSTPLVAVGRWGVTASGIVSLCPDDIIAAW